MTRSAERLGAGRYIESAAAPTSTVTSVHELRTHDGAKVAGVLRTVPGARTVVAIMHPRQDLTHHVLVPELLERGYAVWTQGTRSPNNDIALVHEQALLDVAAGQVFLRDQDFDHVVTLGHSGGGTLFAFYHQQAGAPSGQRLATTPAGRRIDLTGAEMPMPDGAIFMAPHPGQGALLLRLIDPSVLVESDPLSVDPALNPFDPANGFAEPPHSSTYSPEFVESYRAAQRRRIERIDEVAREHVAAASQARRRFAKSADP
ncbi:alpha/beta hydrolase, partial [Nocardia sp. NPDC060220]